MTDTDMVHALYSAWVGRDFVQLEMLRAVAAEEDWLEALHLALESREASADYDERRLRMLVFLAKRQQRAGETSPEIIARLSDADREEFLAIAHEGHDDDL